MKIERISENQIRCTLTQNDFLERELKISELAYGTDKARELFRDMMEQANIDFGFEADDIPLMIEASPVSEDCIVLLVTKVDNPEELDERFSRFGVQAGEMMSMDSLDSDEQDELDDQPDILESPDIINCFEQLNELIESGDEPHRRDEFIPFSDAIKGKKKKKELKKKKKADIHDKLRVFSFDSMNPIIHVAKGVSKDYSGKNSLWKNDAAHRYFLLLNCGASRQAFHSACATLSEYGKEEHATYASETFFNEHYTLIIKDKALDKLSLL
ncbi:MAG: adaptor protein MecA [Eubacterium sp.]|nr:adaptor protein MecA [Eubacterium sp.]